MIKHRGEVNSNFGWLLADVPERQCYGKILKNHLEIPEPFKQQNINLKSKTNFLQLQCSKTPSPRKKRKMFINEPSSLLNVWPSPRLSHSIEVDCNEELEEPRYQFFKIATVLDNRIEDMFYQTSDMQKNTKILMQTYEELEDTTTQMLLQVRNLKKDLKCVTFLEELLCLLEGKTNNIALRKWPFLLMHSYPFQDLNLIV